MAIDLSKTSDKGKSTKVDFSEVVSNLRKKPCCPKCSSEEFDGFSTAFAPMRRCRKCNNEWGGGSGVVIPMSKDEKEQLKEFHASMERDDVYTKLQSLADDVEIMEEVKSNERFSGANRNFWNNYWSDSYVEDHWE